MDLPPAEREPEGSYKLRSLCARGGEVRTNVVVVAFVARPSRLGGPNFPTSGVRRSPATDVVVALCPLDPTLDEFVELELLIELPTASVVGRGDAMMRDDAKGTTYIGSNSVAAGCPKIWQNPRIVPQVRIPIALGHAKGAKWQGNHSARSFKLGMR